MLTATRGSTRFIGDGIPAMLNVVLPRQGHILERRSCKPSFLYPPSGIREAWRLNIPGSCFSNIPGIKCEMIDWTVSPHAANMSCPIENIVTEAATQTVTENSTQHPKENSAPDVNEKNEVFASEAAQHLDGQNGDAKPAQDVKNKVAKSEKNENNVKPEQNEIAIATRDDWIAKGYDGEAVDTAMEAKPALDTKSEIWDAMLQRFKLWIVSLLAVC